MPRRLLPPLNPRTESDCRMSVAAAKIRDRPRDAFSRARRQALESAGSFVQLPLDMLFDRGPYLGMVVARLVDADRTFVGKAAWSCLSRLSAAERRPHLGAIAALLGHEDEEAQRGGTDVLRRGMSQRVGTVSRQIDRSAARRLALESKSSRVRRTGCSKRRTSC